MGRACAEILESRTLLSKVIYVDAAAAGAAHDGTSWNSAYTDLQLALAAATSGDQIRVAQGTYKPTSTTDRTISFQLKDGVSILGGYAGSDASNPDARDVGGYPTILSGDIGNPLDTTDNSYHVVTAAAGLTPAAVLDGFTITAGNPIESQWPAVYGGGIYCSSSSPTLINCTFMGNRSFGMYNDSASPVLKNCSFRGDQIIADGGVYNRYSSPILTNCTFSGTAVGYSGSGGGMYNAHSSPTLTNCAFIGNTSGWGGGMYNDTSSPVLVGCSFTRNSAHDLGGGIYNSDSSPVLTNCTFNGNSSDGDGAGIYDEGSSPKLVNCLFSDNLVKSDYGASAMTNQSSSSPALTNCTFASNEGNVMRNYSSSSPVLTNCIVWGASGGSVLLNDNSSNPVITYSDIRGGYPGAGNISADPLFVRTPWVGPDGVFGTADDDYGDLRIRTGSPVVDIGSNLAVPIGVSTDFAEDARVQGGTVDLGAFEGPVAVSAKAIYVDVAATGANTGVSWANAFTDLQSALLVADDGDNIRVAAGTYKPTTDTDQSRSFALRQAVAIYGGYAGAGQAVPDARNILLYPTILSGEIGATGNADNSYHVVVGADIDSSVLDGVTITGGNGGLEHVGGGMYLVGGGMYLFAASPILRSCTFVGNSTRGSGGGLAVCESSEPQILNCSFLRNTADYGGAVWSAYSSSTSLINCAFVANTAEFGGGMVNGDSSATLTSCTFTANSASNSGGALYNTSTSPVALTNCVLWANTAPAGSAISGSGIVSYSDIQGGLVGVGNVDVDPQFYRPPSPGPDGLRGTADDDYGDLRLRSFSPVADAGNNNAPGLVGITVDLAGNPRFIDIATTADTGSGTAPLVDMGAYEAQISGVDAWTEGPYGKVLQGNCIPLSGCGASDVAGPLSYAWDWDGDGVYDDATGRTPVFSTGSYSGLTTVTLSLRVTDASGRSMTAATTVTVVPTLLYVDGSARGTGDGSSWANAIPDLQEALKVALPGCEIRVGTGVYKPTDTNDRTVSFELKSGVSVIGGYAGFGAANPDDRDPELYRTVLSGDIGVAQDNSDNSYHVVTGNGADSTAVLSGFTITGGNASANSDYSGGGIYLTSSLPEIIDCTVVGNSALCDGGGVWDVSSSPKITNCVFVGNMGGALGNASSSFPVLINCTLTANSADYGGAIYNSYDGSSSTVTNCIVWANVSLQGGNQMAGSGYTITYSDVQGGYAGTGNIAVDPQFVRNPSPGPDGIWGTADDDYGDLHLQVTSPAIGAGDSAAVVAAGFATDLAGNPRIAGAAVDMGAYELVYDGPDTAPTDNALSNAAVPENSPVGTTVGVLSAADSDPGDVFGYILVPGEGATDNASFVISGNELQTNAVFDYETQSSYSIRVRVIDRGGLSFEKVFAISVTDVNEPPTDIALSSNSVPENQPAGTVVGTLSASDPDAGDTFTYSLVSGDGSADNASFVIDRNQLQTAGVFDYEAKNNYSIRVCVTDAGGLSYEKALTINVTDVPDTLALTGTSVVEYRPAGTSVGVFSHTDPNGGTFRYKLVLGFLDDSLFTISDDTLKTAASFVYAARSSYVIKVKSIDSTGVVMKKAFTINVLQDQAPTDIILTKASVGQLLPVGTKVGVFGAVDPDPGESFTYTLLAVRDYQYFKLVNGKLKTRSVFDAAQQSRYVVKVRATDLAGLSVAKKFVITVTA